MINQITCTPTIKEHPFAEYIRILGKGQNGSRHLTMTEAEAAMDMILNNQVEAVQLGAFLLLLRYRLENAEELAGFTKAIRNHLDAPTIAVDVDWPSYAGKKRHYPWYLLSAKLLAKQGVRILMHGAGAHTSERFFTEQFLSALAINNCLTWQEVEQSLNDQQLTFIGLQNFSPKLQQIIELKTLLGVRSPVHSLVRLINPLSARCSLQSIFHPNYQLLHQTTCQLLGDTGIIIKGEGGENELRPDNKNILLGINNGTSWEEEWPAMTEHRLLKPAQLDMNYFLAVWQKQTQNEYANLAITATIALALRGLGLNKEAALKEAKQLWELYQP